jgi:hypothetical protein
VPGTEDDTVVGPEPLPEVEVVSAVAGERLSTAHRA